ncbi:erythromycin esterase family protein [Chitinophaga sp. GCM10012297]|uniref:Erythromycin esterase family protein n=1 Tax=Chitinophaga chungangae TaxID=2821488 RepID=A0ABS3YKN7_9BACT|nr:erythromycin esterase family protein [Chitinophaga chungangae]MBO9154853.1 erythromycin esterase family protein [Chitinophaga chungangae]
MKRHFLPLTALLCLLFSTSIAQQTAPVHAVTGLSGAPAASASNAKPARVSRHFIPLTTTTPGDTFEDLAPLKAGLANVHILGAGEGTHGTHEFFDFKHRLFRFLVEEMGYTVFAIEDGGYGAALIQQYITTGEGDPKAILQKEFHDVFQVQELLGLIEWMRGYNAAHGNRLTFAGFDCQQLDAFVRGIRETTDRYGFDGFLPLTGYTAPENDTAWQAYFETRTIADSIVANMPAKPANIPEKEWEQAVWYLHNVHAGLRQFTATENWLRAINIRDSMMAVNVERIATMHPGEKIMLWAHNGHVGKWHGAMKKYQTLGGHLKKYYGDRYQNLGFTTGSGLYRARSEKDNVMRSDHPLVAPVPGSIELRLHQTGLPLLCFSTHHLPLKGKLRMIGSIAATQQFITKRLKLNGLFDWMVYADQTSAARGL